MIICTNCNHDNPEGSVQCENCYAPLPKTSPCPNCGAFTQINAAFCGQCGYHLLSEEPLAFRELEDDSGNLLNPKDTIPNQAIDYSFRDTWNGETEERQDDNIPLAATSNLDKDEIVSDSLDVEEEISQEVVNVEELVEVEDLEKFAFDDDSESNMFEPDLESDLELDLEAELPEMPGIEDLEVTTARSVVEISDIPNPPLQQEGSVLENSDFDLDLESETCGETEFIEQVVEKDEIEQLILEPNSESEMLESDVELGLDVDVDLELDAEIEEPSLLNEEGDIQSDLVVENTESDQALPFEELEENNISLELDEETSETSEILTLDKENEDIESDIAAEIPEIEENVISGAATSKVPDVVTTPQSWSQPINAVSESATQLQLERILLFHVQTGTDIELSQNLDIIRIGKPNSQVPPDIDVSGFPDANIVSRVHANIRVEGDTYFIEDAGSSNGTYVNHKPLLIGNRHRLRFGDRISLGKGDLMTFIFKIIE